ncbi:bifunctional diguanylate cyclase/phosphodiesterase [Mycolicibacterium sp. CH28]|uniref:putative bifunctional diguanylate cyclase/phosphodiesterase n=1 Tax=Mycolicibacterium sp. CH28 TaxID=2512237 RepID=UPI00108140A5|nr:bifunctional diguanylate cyclase/phosphodiesterase [Mycolicibacterium sp. CH28]TGD86516.1 bifunctional diguanylate cyclase/phosphodiesterase [Mycolicibacterium sp. CH28]
MAGVRATPSLVAVVVAGSLALGCSVWLLGRWSGTSGLAFAANTDTMLVVFAIVAGFAAATTAQRHGGRERAAWVSLSIGLLAFVVGAAIWRYYKIIGIAPFPSVADAAFLVLPVAALVAFLLLTPTLSRTSRTLLILDGVIAAASFTIVAWAGLLDDVWPTRSLDEVKVAVSMTYPVLDSAVLTVAVLVLARARPGQRLTLALLTLAVTGIALSDGAFVYFSTHQYSTSMPVLDVGWLAGCAAFVAAAIAGRRYSYYESVVAQHPSMMSVWLPFIPVGAAAVAVFFEPAEDLKAWPIVVAAILLLAAFLGRQLLVMRQNHRLLAAVAEQALQDPLTGVGNRIVFRDHLNHAMQVRRRDGLSVGVLVMDLDDFKVVNDTLGHPVGDDLLSLVADRIIGAVRPGDIVARLGGDEFAVLIEGRVDHSQLVAHHVLEAFDQPFLLEGQDVLIRPSVGLAVTEADEPDLTPEDLLKRADIAMYSAKRSRTGGVHPFNSEMLLTESGDTDLFERTSAPLSAGGAGTVRLLGELRQAIDQLELTLVYQPKFDLRTAEIVGVEALVRWPHPERGLLGPDEFLPLVRRYGLTGSITDLVVNRALDDVVAWRVASLDVPIAVNIFAPSMADLRLPGVIAKALADRNLSPSALTVEITEDLFVDNMDRTKIVLSQLQEHGIRIAIDDFGSGYSALSYMRDLTVDEIKLDRHFIAPILADARAAAVVRAVVNLAGELGLTAVAEGIENAETADWLREHGCRIGQGYHFSPPLPPSELLKLLTTCVVDGVCRTIVAGPTTPGVRRAAGTGAGLAG